MLRIRLRRTGKKHQPHYRIVVAENTAPLTGKFIEVVGHYNPRSKELVIKDQNILNWLDKGAQPSNTVSKLLQAKGLKHNLIVVHKFSERPSKKEQKKEEANKGSEPVKPASEVTEKSVEASDKQGKEETKEAEKGDKNNKQTEKQEEQKVKEEHADSPREESEKPSDDGGKE